MSDPRDLTLPPRVSRVPRADLWRCFMEDALFARWYAPPMLKVVSMQRDMRAGGRFFVKMEDEGGRPTIVDGVVLVCEVERELTFTTCLLPGYVPSRMPLVTGTMLLDEVAGGVRISGRLSFASAEICDQQAQAGLRHWWEVTTDQLEDLAASLGQVAA